MKIGIVIRRLSQNWGGVEMVAVNLAKKLHEEDHEVHVITKASDVQIEGVFVHILNGHRLFSPWKVISFQRKVKKLMRIEKFDLVYSLCQVYPVDIYRVGGGIHRHWMRLQYPNRMFRLIKYFTSLIHTAMVWLEEQIFKEDNCRLFVTNSRLVKNHIVEYFQIPTERIKVIYNGVDHGIFNPGVKKYRKMMREKYQIDDDALVLLFIANDWKRKGLSTIIEALPKTEIEKIRLLVVGRGKIGRYISYAKSRKINPDKLIFAGHTKDVEKYYGMADIFVLPSRYDPFSNACLEAMACGLPVITTKDNGASELIIHNENGFILDDWKDSDNLAEIFKKLNNRNIREKIGNNAVETAKNYTWEKHIEETSKVFDLLINRQFQITALSG